MISGNTRRFAYNAADELISETDGLNRVTSYQYDKIGRMLKRIDPRGAAYTVSWAYDDTTPKVTTSTTSTTTLSAPIMVQYDALGRRRSLQDGSSPTATTFAVDALGRITSVVAPTTGTVGYGYTARGERAQLTYPNGTTVDYSYLPDGQLDLVTQNTTTLADYGYDSAGRRHDVTRANGTTTTWTYDGADRLRDQLTTQTSSTVSQFSYVVDRAGLRQQANETIAGTSRSINYDYDGLRRLTGAITTDTSGATSSGATYDPVGNLTRQPASGPTLVPTYDAANQRDPWSYDAAGNLLADGTTTYSYDALNRVTTRATGGITTTNTYNGDGVLLRQQTGATTTTYTQDLAAPLDQILSDGTNTYVYGAERLAAQQGTTSTWYDADALGSVRQTLDGSGTPSGNPIWYDPWGAVQSGSVPTFGFTGELQQGNDVYLRARWYNTSSGTFTSKDAFAGFPTQPYSLHPYQYGYADPVRLTDPSGKCGKSTFWETAVSVLSGDCTSRAVDAFRHAQTTEQKIVTGGVAALSTVARGVQAVWEHPRESAQVLGATAQEGFDTVVRGGAYLTRDPGGALGSITAEEWGGVAFDAAGAYVGAKDIVRSGRWGAGRSVRTNERAISRNTTRTVYSWDSIPTTTRFSELPSAAQRMVRQFERRKWASLDQWASLGRGVHYNDVRLASMFMGREIGVVQSRLTGRLRALCGTADGIPAGMRKPWEVHIAHTHPSYSFDPKLFRLDIDQATHRIEAVIDWAGNIDHFNNTGLISDPLVSPINNFGYIVGYP